MSTDTRSKHTPGPWEANEYGTSFAIFACAEDADNRIAYCYGDFANRSRTENQANAQLMAMAPDLLIALDELTSAISDAKKRYEAGDDRAIESNMLSATYRQALDAIRKATGGDA